MPVHELDHAVLLTLERSLEALEGRLDKYIEDGDEVTNGQLTELRGELDIVRREELPAIQQDVVDLRVSIERLQTAMHKLADILADSIGQ